MTASSSLQEFKKKAPRYSGYRRLFGLRPINAPPLRKRNTWKSYKKSPRFLKEVDKFVMVNTNKNLNWYTYSANEVPKIWIKKRLMQKRPNNYKSNNYNVKNYRWSKHALLRYLENLAPNFGYIPGYGITRFPLKNQKPKKMTRKNIKNYLNG